MKGCESAWIDETLHELTAHGSAQFPFQYYNSYYDQNDKPGFPWHWHRDVEIVVERVDKLSTHFNQARADLDGISTAAERAGKRAARLDNFDFEELAPNDPAPILGPQAAE